MSDESPLEGKAEVAFQDRQVRVRPEAAIRAGRRCLLCRRTTGMSDSDQKSDGRHLRVQRITTHGLEKRRCPRTVYYRLILSNEQRS